MSSLEITHSTLPASPLLSSLSVFSYMNIYKSALPSVITNSQQLVETPSADVLILAALEGGSH